MSLFFRCVNVCVWAGWVHYPILSYLDPAFQGVVFHGCTYCDTIRITTRSLLQQHRCSQSCRTSIHRPERAPSTPVFSCAKPALCPPPPPLPPCHPLETRGLRGIATSIICHIFCDPPMPGTVARRERPAGGAAGLLQRESPGGAARFCGSRRPGNAFARHGVAG